MIPALVIIEGPTGSGKSSVISRLRANECEGYETRHFPTPPLSAQATQATLEAHFAEGVLFKKPMVLDRWTPSNIAYAQVFGNQKSLGRSTFQSLEVFAGIQYDWSVGVVTLVVEPALLRDRILSRDKETDPIIVERLVPLCLAYSRVRFTRIKHAFVKVTKRMSADETYEAVRRALLEK